jgi:hypothetical protein
MAQQLAFDWPAWLLDRETQLRLYWDERRRVEAEEHRRRELWRQGRYSEVSPPLCWLCPWIHCPPGFPDYLLCPARVETEHHARHMPEACPVTEPIFWRGISVCPWCGGPAYNPSALYVLPACFGPRRYVCWRCWHESADIEYVRDHAHILCALCPMVTECAQAYD